MQPAKIVWRGTSLPEERRAAEHKVRQGEAGEVAVVGERAVGAREIVGLLDGPDAIVAELDGVTARDPGEVVGPGEGVEVARDADLLDARLEESCNVEEWKIRRVGVVVAGKAESFELGEFDV